MTNLSRRRVNIDFSDYSFMCETNEYLMKKFNIPALQHSWFDRIALFSYKMFNFRSARRILHADITHSYLELTSLNMNPLHNPLRTKKLRNRTINIFTPDIV